MRKIYPIATQQAALAYRRKFEQYGQAPYDALSQVESHHPSQGTPLIASRSRSLSEAESSSNLPQQESLRSTATSQRLSVQA